MAKKKQQSLSTGSIVAIVVGIIVVVFMILTFMDSQSNYEEETQDNYQIQFNAQSDTSPCGIGEILGAEDSLCHAKCGDDGYCDNRDVCYQGECYLYPYADIECFDIMDEEYNEYVDKMQNYVKDDSMDMLMQYNNIIGAWNVFVATGDRCRDKINRNSGVLEELGHDATAQIEWYDEVVEANIDFFEKLEENLS